MFAGKIEVDTYGRVLKKKITHRYADGLPTGGAGLGRTAQGEDEEDDDVAVDL